MFNFQNVHFFEEDEEDDLFDSKQKTDEKWWSEAILSDQVHLELNDEREFHHPKLDQSELDELTENLNEQQFVNKNYRQVLELPFVENKKDDLYLLKNESKEEIKPTLDVQNKSLPNQLIETNDQLNSESLSTDVSYKL